jgi:cyclopropane fatty-acyl-phospholipid synthase-like methyltransferase
VKLGLEIGSGSGKYSQLFLDNYPSASLVTADVSNAFLEALRHRCADFIAAGRLHTGHIDTEHTALSDIARRSGFGPGTFDVVYSIDAMVHVDLQFLTAYWISASELLRPGGKIIMTVADATRDIGFDTLIEHVPIYFKHQGRQTTKFEWLCPHLVDYVLGRLGFSVQEVNAPSSRRDYCFVATKG